MTIRTYLIGYILSIGLTLAAFWTATHAGSLALPAIVALAILQLLVQLVFFLHLGRSSARTDATIFAFTLIIVGIVVGGTLWIMHNLMHMQAVPATLDDLYQGGVAAPQNELN